MTGSSSRLFSRRDLIKAAGVSIALPRFARHAWAAGAGAPAKLILLMQTNGTNQKNFWPRAGYAASPILEPVFQDPALRSKSIVVKGLYNDAGGAAGNQHDFGFNGLYSGYRTIAGPRGGGISLDQLLKKKIALTAPFPTQNCGVHAADYPPINANRLSFSYLDAGRPVPCALDVYKLYANYFGSSAETKALSDRRIRRRQSVLDAAAGDLAALGGRLGPDQRRKLEAHTTALREFEQRLTRIALAWADADPAVAAVCRVARPAVTDVPLVAEVNAPVLVRLMLDFVAVAVSCNLVDVVTFQLGRGGEHFHYAWLGIGVDAHDEIAHKDNGDPVMEAHTVAINRWHAEQVAYLVKALDSLPGRGGTVLDDSLVVWGNEMATGPHSLDGIPVVLFGKGGGRLAKTGYMVDQGRQDYHRLGCSLLNVMGAPSAGFGEAPACGPLQGLQA